MENNPSILILYGSQTGTAQDIAERIWRESRFYNFSARVMCMDDYTVQQLIFEPLVVFVASTTGQGEEPENMKTFWKFLLRRSLPSNSLCNVKFAVLGLGDSSYVKFNFVAKRLTRRLTSLGGMEVIEPGYADDQHDLGADAVVDGWISRLWAQLGKLLNFTTTEINLKFQPRWQVSELSDHKIGNLSNESEVKNAGYSQRTPCRLVITENKRTTASNHFQDVRLIKLKSPESLTYTPGDVLMLVPQNSTENVTLLFQIINDGRLPAARIDPTSLVQVTRRPDGLNVPEHLLAPIRISECASKFWDLNVVPRRSVFTILSEITDNQLEKDKLREFSMEGGLDDLYNYCNRPKRTILEVLADFPHAARALSIETLFDVLPPIKPRAFSIASSQKMSPGEIHILLAVVKYKTKLVKPREGLCSAYLSDLKEGDSLFGWIRPGSFRFPQPGNGAIMVGPGTGVAPFRSYIQEMAALNSADGKNLLLFFGCRHRDADFHFADEWSALTSQKSLTMVTAFSRDQTDKMYVQHRIVENGKEVWERLSNGSTVLIAGSSKNMPTSVREAFVQVAQHHGQLSLEEADKWITNLERCGRYQTETWG